MLQLALIVFILSIFVVSYGFATCAMKSTRASVPDTIYVDSKKDLKGRTWKLPKNKILVVRNHGLLCNGTLQGTNSQLYVEGNKVGIAKNIVIAGTWKNKTIHDSWFEFDANPQFNSTPLIKNILSLTNDEDSCHIIFDADRVYMVEHTYKGKVNFSDQISYEIDKNGKKKRNYLDLYTDKLAYTRLFMIPSNTHITMNNRIELKGTRMGVYFMFWQYGKENITIDGTGSFSGDMLSHKYDYTMIEGDRYWGEWGFVFRFSACRNITIKNVLVENAFGDCIIVCADYWNKNVKDRVSRNITIENVTIRKARRNGIAIAAKNAVIRNCTFESCGIDEIKGTAPRAAIDFEPDGIKDYPEIGNENVVMENCKFHNNKHDVSSTHNNLKEYGRVATIIRNCDFSAPIRLNSANWIQFENCHIPDFTTHRGDVCAEEPIRYISFVNCTIERMPNLMLRDNWHNSTKNGTKIKKTYGQK